jgi:hypothetical protein
MNTHKNARLTYLRRLEMVQATTDQACQRHRRAWCMAERRDGPPVARPHLAAGAAGLCDKSSRPACSPRASYPATALAIVELHRQLFL